MNLSSLLDCLKRADFQYHPNQCADILELIEHILSELNFMKKIDRIEVVPYDPNWPNIFETEATKIKQALGNNCIAIHHVGSTSVPGLAAKPIIDIVPVVQNIIAVDQNTNVMEALGYEAKGEYGMLFRRYFQKRDSMSTYLNKTALRLMDTYYFAIGCGGMQMTGNTMQS